MHPAATARGDSLRLTQDALRSWNHRPGPVLRAWLLRALTASVGLLAAVLAIALLTPGHGAAFVDQPPFRVGQLADVRQILARNVLVLALHALACVAGFIAGSSLPIQADARTGISRAVHRHGARAAIGFVIVATLVSLSLQAATLGGQAARVGHALGTSPALLLLVLLPHALPELTALFLPLAAWLTAARRDAWDQLLAATVVTAAIALPVLLVCACWEVYVAPHLVALVI